MLLDRESGQRDLIAIHMHWLQFECYHHALPLSEADL